MLPTSFLDDEHTLRICLKLVFFNWFQRWSSVYSFNFIEWPAHHF